MNYDWLPFAAFVISLISIFLTLLKYFLDWRQTRLKIQIMPHNFYKYSPSGTNTFEITLINKTMHSVSIIDFDFYLKSQKAYFSTKRQSILLFTDRHADIKFYSDGLPINLGPYESKRVFIIIDGQFFMWVHDIKMTVHTNKGKKKIDIKENTVTKKEFIDI